MKGIKRFVKDVFNAPVFEGCVFKKLDDEGVYLVFAYDKFDRLVAKVATNKSALQCDFYYDWNEVILDDDDMNAVWDPDDMEDYHGSVDKFVDDVKYVYKHIECTYLNIISAL